MVALGAAGVSVVAFGAAGVSIAPLGAAGVSVAAGGVESWLGLVCAFAPLACNEAAATLSVMVLSVMDRLSLI
jgi:hypothetical protein